MFNLDFIGKEEEKKTVQKKKSSAKGINLEKIPGNLILALVFLLPIFFLPLSVSSLASAKMFLIYILVLIPIIVLLFTNLKKDKINIPWNLLGLSLVLIPVVYIIAGVFSDNVSISFLGRDLALDSVVAILTFFGLMVVTILTLGKKTHQVLYLYLILFLSSLIIVVFQLLHLLIPMIPTLGFFGVPISTTLGKWNDLGFFSTLIVMLSAITIDQVKLIKSVKTWLYITFILNLLLVIIVNFTLFWYILGIFAVVYFVYQLFNSDKEEGKKTKSFSKLSIIIFIISVLLLISGGNLENKISSFLNINHLEARPSFVGTMSIAGDTLKESPILGSGPATFELQWPKYRPQSILTTTFWNNDFRYGFGFIPSFLTTTGILGILTWLFFFVMLIFYSVKAFLNKPKDSNDRFVLFSSFIGTITLWVITIFYLPSATLIALTFLFTGIYIVSLSNLGLLKTKKITAVEEGKGAMIFTLISIALIIFVILVGYKMSTKFVAQVYFQKSVSQLTQPLDGSNIEANILRAAKLDPTDTYFKSAAQINAAKLEGLVVAANNGEDISREEARLLVNTVIANYNQAIEYAPGNYNNYLGLANFYRSLVLLGTEGVYDLSKSSYGRALELKPDNPLIYLEAARLELLNQNNDLAMLTIEKALELKPNYSDAAFFVAQLEINRGRANQALAVLNRVSNTTPNDPTMFFQIGVLSHGLEKFDESVAALERSVGLNSGFQNARYFLGLSYYEVGKVGDAVVQFEILQNLNPNNTEVELILNNLKNGNAPFTGAQPPIVEPEEKEELPLDDTVEEVEEEISEEVIEEEKEE